MISKLIVYCVFIRKGISSLTSVTVIMNIALYLCSVYIDRLCHLNTSLSRLHFEWLFFININFYLIQKVAMVKVACPREDCGYETQDYEPVIVAALLQAHATTHVSAASTVGSVKSPRLDRPRIDTGVDQETWNMFLKRWDAFRVGSGIPDTVAAVQLLQCASVEMYERLLKDDDDLSQRSMSEVLKAMHTVAVIPVARGIVRNELKKLTQANDESFRAFAARVRGKAKTCAFELKVTCPCPCQKQFTIDYTVEETRDVLLAGIGSADIKQEALIADQMQEKTINELVEFVEKREMARSAVAAAQNQSAVFTANKGRHGVATHGVAFSKRRASFATKQATSHVPIEGRHPEGRNGEGNFIACPVCNEKFRPYRRFRNGRWNKKPFKECLSCWRSGHRRATPGVHLQNAECAISQTYSPPSEAGGSRPSSTSRSDSGNASLL